MGTKSLENAATRLIEANMTNYHYGIHGPMPKHLQERVAAYRAAGAFQLGTGQPGPKAARQAAAAARAERKNSRKSRD